MKGCDGRSTDGSVEGAGTRDDMTEDYLFDFVQFCSSVDCREIADDLKLAIQREQELECRRCPSGSSFGREATPTWTDRIYLRTKKMSDNDEGWRLWCVREFGFQRMRRRFDDILSSFFCNDHPSEWFQSELKEYHDDSSPLSDLSVVSG